MNKAFWCGKKVLVTGHTGFKGTWLSLTLKSLGAKVVGFSDNVPTSPSAFELTGLKNLLDDDIRGDIRDLVALKEAFTKHQPEILFHLAAQSLVRKSYTDPVETYSTNVMGTLNVLLSVQESLKMKSIVCITTDKCYENKEWVWPYRESDHLGGHDPYSSSKACSEILAASMRNSFLKAKGIHLATVRAGNVIGGGDWAESRIIPDLVRAYEAKQKLEVRNPSAIRPWQHVMEPVIGYLMIAEKLHDNADFAEAWNFGPEEHDCLSVQTVIEETLATWKEHPGWKFVGDKMNLHEAQILKLDCSKAKAQTGWKPKMSLRDSLKLTSDWYQAYFKSSDMNQVTTQQIEMFLR
jgi:CDP-glucose 4,6-dehydratase